MTEKFDKFAYHWKMGNGLTDGEYRVLAVMWNYAKPDGTDIRPTHKVLAEQCGMGSRTVTRHVASLVTKGWLHVDRPGRNVGRNGGAAKYRLTTPGTLANTGHSSAPDADETPANPDQNSGQSVQEQWPIRVGTLANTGHLIDQEQIKRTDQGKDQEHDSSPLRAEVTLNSGNAREDEEIEQDGPPDDHGWTPTDEEPTDEELDDIEHDTDERISMTALIQADPFGFEAEEEQRRQDEENEWNRQRDDNVRRLLERMAEEERAREMAV
jgi:Helix-turn-helix domain